MNYPNVQKRQTFSKKNPIGSGCNSLQKYAFSTKHAQKFHHHPPKDKKPTHFQLDFFCVKSLHNLNIIEKLFCLQGAFIINSTHIIRICPKILYFLTYEIHYISLKHSRAYIAHNVANKFLRYHKIFKCRQNQNFERKERYHYRVQVVLSYSGKRFYHFQKPKIEDRFFFRITQFYKKCKESRIFV